MELHHKYISGRELNYSQKRGGAIKGKEGEWKRKEDLTG